MQIFLIKKINYLESCLDAVLHEELFVVDEIVPDFVRGESHVRSRPCVARETVSFELPAVKNFALLEYPRAGVKKT
jgi:hypothetical protein